MSGKGEMAMSRMSGMMVGELLSLVGERDVYTLSSGWVSHWLRGPPQRWMGCFMVAERGVIYLVRCVLG